MHVQCQKTRRATAPLAMVGIIEACLTACGS